MICETIRLAFYDLNIIIIYSNGNRTGKQGIILREYMKIFLLTNAFTDSMIKKKRKRFGF